MRHSGPYRALRILSYVWLLTVTFWSLLPSPTIPFAQEALHNEETLKTSHTLTVVDSLPTVFENSSRSNGAGHLIFQLRIVKQLNLQSEVELTLKVAENEPINLADLMKRSEAYHFSKTKHDAVRTPFFDPTLLDFEVPWVDDIAKFDVCLPWFDRSDKALFTHGIHGGTSAIYLRMVVDENGAVEIWPASFVEHTLTELEKVRLKPEAADYEEGQLLEETMQFLRESGHPILQLKGGDMTKLEEVSVSYVRGNLPSKTYHIRKTMLARLGPALRIALLPVVLVISLLPAFSAVIIFILYEGGLACAGIMLSAWLRAGRPEFWPWTRTFWMTRWMYFRLQKEKRMWGPAGPVESKRAVRKQWVGNGIVGLQRPKTARLEPGINAV
ncbi:hypothetical protein P171DRAFT_43223 [Karstenula rhodostoma CBS 690.94]|uniref:Uncharacterized protein n=1 Tax=Karstenula rhodostoma CBS 690.94 TaxID=1392251 RepID=A0A9P4PEV1_9PLEO|nr:hypothetical protein P171DRAFT_43223 [Karstenula rhodostoma CBS 690.94]